MCVFVVGGKQQFVFLFGGEDGIRYLWVGGVVKSLSLVWGVRAITIIGVGGARNNYLWGERGVLGGRRSRRGRYWSSLKFHGTRDDVSRIIC